MVRLMRVRTILGAISCTVAIVKERDPAAKSALEVLVCYPGLHALWLHRISHQLWVRVPAGRLLARIISQLGRWVTGIEIHPGARIGRGVFIDHGMGVVIGETAVIGDNCLLYQGVTLGGTGKAKGRRHPRLAENVVVGAGAKILGAIEVGPNTRIGAGSVLLRDVGADCTVVGIPGRVVHQSGVRVDPLAHSALPDAEAQMIRSLMQRLDQLEGELAQAQSLLLSLWPEKPEGDTTRGTSQNLKDREILSYLGDVEET